MFRWFHCLNVQLLTVELEEMRKIDINHSALTKVLDQRDAHIRLAAKKHRNICESSAKY